MNCTCEHQAEICDTKEGTALRHSKAPAVRFQPRALTPELRHHISLNGPETSEGPDEISHFTSSPLSLQLKSPSLFPEHRGSTCQQRWSKKTKKWVDEQCEWERLIAGETRNWSVVENKENKMPFLIALRNCFYKMCYRNCTITHNTHSYTHKHVRTSLIAGLMLQWRMMMMMMKMSPVVLTSQWKFASVSLWRAAGADLRNLDPHPGRRHNVLTAALGPPETEVSRCF